jgi:DNA-directed RNA polymerase sigma subunit (sigma70/sigma32)
MRKRRNRRPGNAWVYDPIRDLSEMVRRIEHRLAVAYGQGGWVEGAMLQRIACMINDAREPVATELRRKVCEQNLPPYLPHNTPKGETSVLAPYIRADLFRRQEERKIQQLQPPSAEQAKLVFDHIPLVRKFARSIARGDRVLFEELEALGLRALEEKARTYDSTRGFTFGTHARLRVRGAMIDHVRENGGRMIAVGGMTELAIAGRRKSGRKASKTTSDDMPIIWSAPEVTASGHIRQTHNTPPPKNGIKYYTPAGKLLPTRDMSVIETLIPKLNPRQQAVYRGRVLTHPPVSRTQLAHQLRIADETQISRIERQAQRKMTAWLKVSP